MRIKIAIAGSFLAGISLVLLTGCVVVPHQAWTFDPTRPSPKPALAPQEAVPLTDRLAQLQLERNAIRTRIASERDAMARQGLYLRLHEVGMELSQLERRLAAYASAR